MANMDYSLCEHEDCEEGAVGRYGEVSLCREHLHGATGTKRFFEHIDRIDYGPMAADAFVPPQTEGMTRQQSRVVHEDTSFIVIVLSDGKVLAIEKHTAAFFVEPEQWEQVARSMALTLRDKT